MQIPSNSAELRKSCIKLSMMMRTGVDYFTGLSVFDLFRFIEEVSEVGQE